MKKQKTTINIGGTGRQGKRIAIYPIYKKNPEDIPEQPKPEEMPIIEEAKIEKEISSRIVLSYEVLWNKRMEHPQVVRIKISNESFLNDILEGLNKNLARFEWSPIIWCENQEHTEISAIGEVNEKNIMELKNFIDEIKSNYDA